MHVSSDTDVSPCCLFKEPYSGSPAEYLDSDFLNSIKKQMLDNIPPKNCSACSIAEAKNGHSFRMLHNNFRPDLIETVLTNPTKNYIENISVVTSNICNLKCLPCCDGPSYTRMVELKKLNLIKYTPVIQTISDNFVDKLQHVNFKKLTVLGGEPFYDRHCMALLTTLVENKRSNDIDLDINTNCTFLDEKIIEYLSNNFKFVQIKASIDGVGIVNDYLRYPSNWVTIEKSLKALQNYENINTIVTTALSNLALIKYYDVIEWAVDFGIRDLFLTPVSAPNQLSVVNLPRDIKQSLEKKYLKLKEKHLASNTLSERTLFCVDTAINTCRETTDYDMLPTLEWLSKHDKLRNTNCFDVFHELIDYAKT